MQRSRAGLSATLATLAALAGGCLALAGLLWLLQPYLVFQPAVGAGGPTRTPADVGLEYEDVRLPAGDGVTLAGWFLPHADPAAPVVLFLHGNAGDIGDRVESLHQLHEAGAAVLIIDYRGYGESTGRPTEAGTYRDARAAWDWLTRARGVAPARIVVFGRSLGGPIAAHLARRVRPAGLVLESTFTSLPALAADLYPWLPARWLSRYRYATADYLAGVRCPTLVAHARGDEIVSFDHARRLAAIRPPVVELVELAGGHNDAFLVSGPRYTRTLAGFIDRVTGAADDAR